LSSKSSGDVRLGLPGLFDPALDCTGIPGDVADRGVHLSHGDSKNTHQSFQAGQNGHPTRPQATQKPQAYPRGYVEDFCEPRTKLGAIFTSQPKKNALWLFIPQPGKEMPEDVIVRLNRSVQPETSLSPKNDRSIYSNATAFLSMEETALPTELFPEDSRTNLC
jgi:hypothetical protein